MLVGADGYSLWGYEQEFDNENDPLLIATLRNALPQIVAVVEAAEITTTEYDADNPFVGYSIEALATWLAALDEALT